MRRRPLTEEQIIQAVQWYEAGESLARIGERLDVMARMVHLALRARGVQMRRPWDHLRQ